MRKILLLCFIHGFKGGQDTFGPYPERLRILVSRDLPHIDVRTIVYPRYETRGNLAECVNRFREWLTEKVIDLEVCNGKSSPALDPSVRVILLGHSMGGILAADAVRSLALDFIKDNSNIPNKYMFPYIQGILALDTPYLGIAPSVLAHFNPVSMVGEQLGSLANLLWEAKSLVVKAPGDAPKEVDAVVLEECPKKEVDAVAPPASPPADTTPTTVWQRWAKVGAFAGTSVVLAAGGAAAAYMKRDSLKEGWSWVGSHLEFVGCLIKAEEMQRRVTDVARLHRELGLGFGNLYTRLGKGAVDNTNGATSILGWQRTFCNIPIGDHSSFWQEIVNDSATNEMCAHTVMFSSKDNSGYDNMSYKARDLILGWTKNEWYLTKAE